MNIPLKFKHLLWVSLILILTIACNLLTGLQQDLETVKSTAAILATEAGADADYVGTAQALLTQAVDNDLLATAKALVTEAGESGIVETMQALVTQQAPGLEQTLQALATDQGPALKATAQAVLTQVPPLPHQPPQDIPLVGGEKENLVTLADTVSYITPLPLADVVTFYKTQMPAQGWTLKPDESLESQNAVVLTFQKDNRIATITITPNLAAQKTTVIIYIQTK